jgi:hypothetical protein
MGIEVFLCLIRPSTRQLPDGGAELARARDTNLHGVASLSTIEHRSSIIDR